MTEPAASTPTTIPGPRGARSRQLMHLTTTAAALTAATTLLPWVQSGEAVRNGFALADTARNLGVVEGGLRLLLQGVFALPALAAATFLAAVARRRLVVATVTLLIAGVAVAGGTITLSVDLDARIGPYAAVALGTLSAAAASVLVVGKEAHR